jgi:hypothetical protein
VRRAENLITFIADWISWSLKLLEPSELVQGLLYLRYNWINLKVKGKKLEQSRNRPGAAQKVPGGLDS